MDESSYWSCYRASYKLVKLASFLVVPVNNNFRLYDSAFFLAADFYKVYLIVESHCYYVN